MRNFLIEATSPHKPIGKYFISIIKQLPYKKLLVRFRLNSSELNYIYFNIWMYFSCFTVDLNGPHGSGNYRWWYLDTFKDEPLRLTKSKMMIRSKST